MAGRIGYGNPPEHSRWRKGQSGNSRGRPKGTANFVSDLMAELAEVIQVTEGGKPKRITKQRAMIKAVVKLAIKEGDPRAASLLITSLTKMAEANPALQLEPDLSAAERQVVEDFLEREVDKRLAQRKENK